MRFKLKNVIARLFVLCVVVCLIVTLPLVGDMKNENLALIYKVFVGARSKYDGVIEIWNIDSFENGKVSKVALLNEFCRDYQNKNKGVYFVIRSVTENECVNMLNDGQIPDMISCSYGVAEKIKSYVQALNEKDFNLYENFKNAGRDESGVLYGAVWCFGSYYLISNKSAIEKSGIEIKKDADLLEMSLKCGYKISRKNSEKIVYSLELGCGAYAVPQKALFEYSDKVSLSLNNFSLNKNNLGQTSYSAYCRFIAGESVMLLGSQRDVFRMQNRISLGKIDDVMFKPLTRFTDMLQFMFLTKCDDVNKNESKQDFLKFVLEKRCQEKVVESGLFSAMSGAKFNLKQGVMQDIILENISNYTLNDVFIGKDEIDKLRDENLN